MKFLLELEKSNKKANIWALGLKVGNVVDSADMPAVNKKAAQNRQSESRQVSQNTVNGGLEGLSLWI